MSESENENAQEQGPQFMIQRIYTKDISFETPNSPIIFTEKWEPDTNVELNTSGSRVTEDTYEIVLSVTVTTKLGEKTAYLAEIQQAGIFIMSGFSEPEMGAMIHSFCPNLLFPYVREVVSDLVAKGSFPQIVLQPVNFEQIYSQHLQRKQAEGEQSTETLN